MIPKEKAVRILDLFDRSEINLNDWGYSNLQRKLAEACVNEIISACTDVTGKTTNLEYWELVKAEIWSL